MRRLILPFAIAVAVSAALSGCGQKGDLFLPPPPAAGTTANPQGAHPASASTVDGPAKASSTITPFNSVIHQ
ncbi:putative lipoprotein [Luteibacter sp. OK325]|jgi:predicted small lipoprotein YifL|uniref:LPS translocon maturation chaperone LptM n=1 Tax=Luteibacter sp. OK325 TaxID=2135670 RepID=UPI000D3A8B66|nr:lipoprotein [Luteibacter sp. OK325]PTR32673.1 putative lipoprotein [Luteibacter sp. OK325]